MFARVCRVPALSARVARPAFNRAAFRPSSFRRSMGHGHSAGPAWAAATEHERLATFAKGQHAAGVASGKYVSFEDVRTKLLGKSASADSASKSKTPTPEQEAKIQAGLDAYYAAVAKASQDAPASAEFVNRFDTLCADLPASEATLVEDEWVLEQTSDGLERPSFVPAFLAETRIITIHGERIVVPQMHETLEWVMSSPMDYHTFEEVPAVKDSVNADHLEDNKKE